MPHSAIIVQLETASVEIDALLDDLHHARRRVRTLEDIEERVKAISDRLILAVRGKAALQAPREQLR